MALKMVTACKNKKVVRYCKCLMQLYTNIYCYISFMIKHNSMSFFQSKCVQLQWNYYDLLQQRLYHNFIGNKEVETSVWLEQFRTPARTLTFRITMRHNTTSNMKCKPNTHKKKIEVLYLCAVLLNACGIIPCRVSKGLLLKQTFSNPSKFVIGLLLCHAV